VEYEKPEYSMSFDDDSSAPIVQGTEDRANDLTKQVLRALNPAPVIDDVSDSYVKLPAGLIKDSVVIQDAEVQELTGEHEERLAKAKASGNAAKYVNTLLQCGVVSIGDTKITPALLDSLIQGDLDTLLMGIRRATFGDEFHVDGVACPTCGEFNDLTLNLVDIPIKELDDPEIREFEVKLRKGTLATIKFPTGAVQNEIFKRTMSVPEMNSLTLAACVMSFQYTDGKTKPCNGLADVKKLGLADRKTIQDFIYDNQPGPRYDQVTARCHSCEGEVPVPLSVGILFREL
jgi:hypothetical protein